MGPVGTPVISNLGTRVKVAEEIFADGRRAGLAECRVVEEDVLTIEVEGVGSYALMWTPTEDNSQAAGFTIEDGVLSECGVPESLALAAGFAFTEGIVERVSDIVNMSVCPERADVVRMVLANPEGVAVRRRNVVMNSSCGVCGGRDQLEAGMACTAQVPDTVRLSVADFLPIRDAMLEHQGIFGRTGGAHGAAVFDRELRVVAVAEDLGRHNALDKVIGYRFLSGLGFDGCGVYISSRISYEMVAKSVRAGFEVVAAISAPSSMAIDLAERFGITLCGFVRGTSAKVYSHPHRLTSV